MAQSVPLPDGTKVTVRPGETPESAYARAQKMYPEAFASDTPVAQPRKGVLADVMGSAKNLVNISKTGIGALTGDSNAAAQAGLERQAQLQKQYESGFQPEKILAEYDKGNYLSAAGEALSQVPSAVASLLPSAGQAAGSAVAGRIGGGALGSFFGPAGTVVGATVGQYAAPFIVNAIQALGSQAQEEAQEQLRKGEQVDVDVAELAPYASANAALNLLGTRIAMPSVFKKAIGQKVAAEADDVARLALLEKATKVAGRGNIETVARGTLGFAAGELPTEILQDVVDRAAVGKPLTDEEAMQSYRITALNMVLGAPLGGAVGLQERSGARTQVGLQEQRDRQAKAVADAQTRSQAAAEKEAERQTPQFAVEAQTRYNALLAQVSELDKVANAELPKNDLAGQELKRKARAERKALLATDEAKTAIADWNASKANLPAAPPAPPAPITDITQLKEQPLFPEAAVPTTPELDIFGNPMPQATPEAALEEQPDPMQQARALEGYLNQLRAENKNLPVNAYEKRSVLAEREKTVAKALDVINSQIPKPIDVAALRKNLDALHTKIKNAADLGDVVASERYSSKAKALEEQIANATVAPSTQQEMELLPFKSTVTGDRQRAVRNLAPAVNLGAEEQEADVNALTALGQDNRETPQTYAEKLALLGMRKPGSAAPEINAQLGLFGPNDQPELAPQRASAALGQMKQSLTGEDVTATGPSEERGIIQRGGKAPFNLYARQEGTEEPITAEALRQRIYDLGKREDLTPEAAAFLRRVEPLIGENDTTLETDNVNMAGREIAEKEPRKVPFRFFNRPVPNAKEVKNRSDDGSFFTLLDEQLRKIEAGAEGITPEGFGKPALYQGFPVETRRGLVTTPTAAESQADLQNLKSGEAAKALAKTRAKRYQQGIADGESPSKAAYNARLIVQPDEEAMRSVLPQGQVPVQKRGDAITETTLRGPSGRAKPLAIPNTLEQQLRQIEQYRQTKSDFDKEPESQLALFPEEQAKIQPIVRATAANFQKFLDSKTAAAMRDNEKASNKLTEQLPQATKVFRKISEIEAEFNRLSAIKQKAEGARNTLAQNEAAMQWGSKEYGKLMADPMFVSLLNLTEASRSEEHAGLLRSIAIHEEIATAFGSKIKEAQGRVKDIGKRITSLKDRVRLDMLNKQVLEIEGLNKANQSVLDKLNSLKDTASAASAAVEHIQAIRATLEAQKTLQEIKDTEPTTAELKAAQAELVAARAARIVAEQNSRAQSTLRDTRDRSYATRRKADEISAARTRAWNVLSQLPSTKYRALTSEERKVYQTAYAEEVPLDTETKSKEIDEALKYEQQLAGQNVQSLKMELGIVEKAMRELVARINAAKAKSISFLKKALSKKELDKQESIDAKKPKGITTQPEAQLKALQLQGVASMLKDSQLAGDSVRAFALKKEFDAISAELAAFEKAKKKPATEKSASLTMYGPKGSPFTKPAFTGVEGFIKKQAELSVKLDALEKELAVKEAAAAPISKGARGEEVARTIAPATALETDEVGMAEEKAALYAIRKESVNNATAALEEAKKEGDKKAVALAARALIDARNAFAETVVSARQRVNALTNTLAVAKAAGDKTKVADTEARLVEARNALAGDIKLIRSRTQQLVSSQTAAPSKLRTGSAESRAIPGIIKNRPTEAPVYKAPSVEEAVADANKFAAERLASNKALTKKEIKETTRRQQEALQRAAFDRLQTVTTQVANAQQKVDNLKQAQAEYKAGRRATFNVDVMNKANTDLEEFKRSLMFAKEQAGILEDVGTLSAAEVKEEKRAQAAETKKGKGKADVAAQETEAAVSNVYAGENDSFAKLMDEAEELNLTVPHDDVKFAVRDNDIMGVIDGLAKHGSTPAIRERAKGLREFLYGTTIGVDRFVKYKGEMVAGLYEEGRNKITMHPNRVTEEDLLHELTHAATTKAMRTPDAKLTPMQREAKQGIINLFKAAEGRMDLTGQYGIKNVHEFMSEVNSSKDFRDRLDGIGKPESLWQKLKRLIAGLFNQPPSKAALDLIEKIYMPSETYFAKEGEQQAFAKVAKYGEDNALSQLARDVVSDGSNSTEKVMDNFGLKFEMNYVDMRAALRKVLDLGAKAMGDSRLFQQAMFSYTDADQKMALTYAAMNEGYLKLSTDSKGFKFIESSGKESVKDVFVDTGNIPDRYGNEEAKVGIQTAYLAAHRAANKGLSKLDLDALKLTEEKMAAALAAADADFELKAALEKTRETYNAYNEGMIRMVQDSGAISKAFANELLKDKDYVPYYRVRQDGTAVLVLGNDRTITVGDIKHQPWLKELKGGETKILPITQSIPRNTTLLVSMATSNMARRNFAYAMQAIGQGQGEVDSSTGRARSLMPILSGKGPDDPSIIRFKQEPDPNKKDDTGDRYIRIQTKGTVAEGVPAELVIKSMEGAPLTLPAFLKWGGIAGDLLRKGITRMPMYLMRQLFRDPMSAAATSGLGYGMLPAVYKANKEFLKMTFGESEKAANLLKKGLIQSGIFTGDPDDVDKMALQLVSGKDFNIIDKVCRGADKLAMNADAATRTLVYDNAIKNGMSEAEAKFAVQESVNFSKRGLSPTVQYASRLIPFFNAQIQGLNVLYKAGSGQMPFEQQLQIRQKFYNNALFLVAGGLAYAAAMQDDEYYKNAKPKDRYSNFFLHTPFTDEPLKLPIPYEFGWFFSMAVAAVDGMVGQTDGEQQLKALLGMLKGAVPGASSMLVPQLVKPLAEVFTNKDFNTWNALESTRLRGKSTEERYNANTTELAKAVSQFAPVLSPIQIERIVGGYLGSLPILVAAATNGLFRDGDVEPVPKNMSEMPFFGSGFQKKYGGADSDVMYDLADEALQAKRSFDAMKREGRIADAQEYLQDHRTELRAAPLALQYQKLMGNLRTIEERIKGSNIPGDEKRKRIDELQKRRQDLAEKFAQRIKQMES